MSCRAAFDELSGAEADGPNGPEETPAVMWGRKTGPCQGAALLGDPAFPGVLGGTQPCRAPSQGCQEAGEGCAAEPGLGRC